MPKKREKVVEKNTEATEAVLSYVGRVVNVQGHKVKVVEEILDGKSTIVKDAAGVSYTI